MSILEGRRFVHALKYLDKQIVYYMCIYPQQFDQVQRHIDKYNIIFTDWHSP